MAAKFKTDSKHGLTLDYRPLELEQEIREFWEKNRIPKKLIEFKEQTHMGVLGYVEGPPTLNGDQHVGHARGRVMKDFRYRFKTMQGYFVTFRAGWDTQGLPIELEVEQKLRVKSKKEMLEQLGEERFVAECKETVKKYYQRWVAADSKLGLFIDYDKAYWTHHDEYIQREWQYLKKAWNQQLLGEGYYVVAYCPHCQTSLSNAEVGLGYKEVEDTSLYFKLALRDVPNENLLVWTTMPFTLITDMLVAVHPKGEYAKVKVDNETWILAKQRVEPLMAEFGIEKYEVTQTITGKDLEGVKYEYPFTTLIPQQQQLDTNAVVHTVISADFVDLTTATGIVHLSPANGEDDFFIAQRLGLPMYAPYDDECRFTEAAGKFAGVFARDADAQVVDELRSRGLLVSAKTVRHEYPTCWRSHHKLIWLARREYFLWTNKINADIVDAAENVEYFYESPKNRFLAFLREGKPWCISRERVWGAPLPVWVCKKCGQKTLISSKRELREQAAEWPQEDFELHKPWIDRVILKCPHCQGRMLREPFVLDCWHNSGASPYAGFTDTEFRTYVPVDFLTEAVDQTRGWANSLLLEHVIFTRQPEAPYKAFLFYGFVLDAHGRKMSKSLGNVIEVNPLLQTHSADVSRFYFLWKCSPIESMNFDVNDLRGRPYQVLSTLYHLHRFLLQNAEYDAFNPRKHTLDWVKQHAGLDTPHQWLLSVLQRTIREVTDKAANCQFHFALSTLEDFVVNILSRQYIPLIRRDLWSDDPKTLERRLTVYATLWHTLKRLILLFNPATPYLSEALYQKVYRKLDANTLESVNFEPWPEAIPSFEDTPLEQEFEILMRCVSLVHAARQTAHLKRRWPLQRVIVVAPKTVRNALERLERLFRELVNVKKVEYKHQLPPFDKDTWTLAADGDLKIVLHTYRDETLQSEGLVRDLSRRVQALRKELGYLPTDVLNTVHIAELDAAKIRQIEPYLEEMAELVRAKKVTFHQTRVDVADATDWYKRRLDKLTVYIAIS